MRLKFISLNIWGGQLFDELVVFLKQQQPDIVSLQEVYNGQDQSLPAPLQAYYLITKELSFPYHSFAPAFGHVRAEGTIERGNAIFSRFPLQERSSLFFDAPYTPSLIEAYPYLTTPYLMQHAVVTVSSRKIVDLFNVHGLWGKDPNDNDRRLTMSDTIVKETQGKPSVIISGDFNVKESSQTIGNISKKFTNVFAYTLSTTFNLKQKTDPDFQPEVVDFIFLSSDLMVVNKIAPTVDVSDHMPLVAEIDVPDHS